MKSRHLFMISLGGVIGTGFFLGTGYTINEAGPIGAILSYLAGGMIMYFTMLCLGELAVAMPVSGSFQAYATKFIGPATGFAVGWIYWLGWSVTVALEFLSAGRLMKRWFPDVGVWIWCLIFGRFFHSMLYRQRLSGNRNFGCPASKLSSFFCLLFSAEARCSDSST